MERIVIKNIGEYTLEFADGNLILNPRKTLVNEEEITKSGFLTDSEILSCDIYDSSNNLISDKRQYAHIVREIWKVMPVNIIIQNTTFNMKHGEIKEKGYNYIPEIGYSYQAKCAQDTFKEIIKLVKLNNYRINASIKLKNGKEICFEIN